MEISRNRSGLPHHRRVGCGDRGDCIGLVVSSYTNSQVVYQFGSGYTTYGTANSGDAYTLTVQGVAFSGTVNYS